MKRKSILLCGALTVLLSMFIVIPVDAMKEFSINGESSQKYFIESDKPFKFAFKDSSPYEEDWKKHVRVKKSLYRTNDSGHLLSENLVLDFWSWEKECTTTFPAGKYILELWGEKALPCECGCDIGKKFEGGIAKAYFYFPEETSPLAPPTPKKVVFHKL